MPLAVEMPAPVSKTMAFDDFRSAASRSAAIGRLYHPALPTSVPPGTSVPHPLKWGRRFLEGRRLLHTSPTAATRSAIVRNVKLRGPTSPRSISSHVHGADTGAPGFGRTAYAAAN